MEQQRYSRITVQISDTVTWHLYSDGKKASIESADISINDYLSGIPDEKGLIIFNKESDTEGVSPFAVFENTTYRWELLNRNSDEIIKLSSPLISAQYGKCGWNTGIYGNHGDFTVKNYLGSSYISIEGYDAPFFCFDIISKKLDYYSEYRSLVEAVAEQCSQLLLEWDSPVSLSFTPDPAENRRIILEQFLFLRHVLKPENLQLYLEIIGRNPDNNLKHEEEWKPAGAVYDPEIYTEPVRNGRGWYYGADDGNINPEEIMVRSSYETLNTPANKFIKYALNIFREVTMQVIDLLEKENNPFITSLMEAGSMLNTLDVFLALPFFRDVEMLSYIPYNSQVLQKREGYRQILHAWLMLEAASRLDWQGKNDAYEGTNRNAAVLYEYWLYFVLFSIVKSIDGFTLKRRVPSSCIPDFISVESGGMTVNLKSGSQSIASFISENININLYYNRSFPGTAGNESKSSELFQSSSYSRRLVPDYSIVIFPESMSEQEAEEKGLTVWIHFDAKYRAELFSEIFGTEDPSEEEKEKEERAYSVYRRGDLYKMHTYNEAIRRTAGSYVLYPGSPDKGVKFSKYHEILPGVGAFPVRPDEKSEFNAEGASAVKEFIEEVIKTNISNYTDHYRINYWTNNTIVREDHIDFISSNVKPAMDVEVAVIPLRNDELLERCLECGFFYFHSEYEDGRNAVKNRKLLNADYILPVNMHTGKPYGVIFKITDADSAGRDTIKKEINSSFFKGSAKIYFRCFIDKKVIEIRTGYTHNSSRPGLETWKRLF